MTTLVTGATGLVGSELAKALESVVATSRNAARAKEKLSGNARHVIQWSPTSDPLQLADAPAIDSVVNLMGDSIAKGRWNAAKKKSMRDSRVSATERLVDAVLTLEKKPDVVVSASAVGFYGDRSDDSLTEASSKGDGFLADLSHDWEQATSRLTEAGIRTVLIRIGIVLSADGGALAEMVTPFKFGIGGPLGNGKHFFPWIHIDDLVGIILHAIRNENISGPVNAVAPGIVTNKQWTKQLAKQLRRPAILPVPKFALRLLLGEFADSLFFSQNVKPEAAIASGYKFQFADLPAALNDLLAQ